MSQLLAWRMEQQLNALERLIDAKMANLAIRIDAQAAQVVGLVMAFA